MGDMPQLGYVVKGMKRTAPPRSVCSRLPVIPEILTNTRQSGLPARTDGRQPCLRVFFGFLRTEEVVTPSDSSFDSSTHLMYGDIRVDNMVTLQYLEVKIKASKTDPYSVRGYQCT